MIGILAHLTRSDLYEHNVYRPAVAINASRFEVVGGKQKEVLLSAGVYKIEAWGGRGGHGLKDGVTKSAGGRGAYAGGLFRFRKDCKIFLYAGERGSDGNRDLGERGKRAWNGGGHGGYDGNRNPDTGGGGGGASDVRLVGGAWDNQESLKSRILVAGGGSGAVHVSNGAPGGSYECLMMKDSANPIERECKNKKTGAGSDGDSNRGFPMTGGGGGYYTGFGGAPQSSGTQSWLAVSASGSSYVYGLVKQVKGSAGTDPTEYVKKAGIEYISGVMKRGNEYWTDLDGVEKEPYNGHGWIRITQFTDFSTRCTNGNKKVVRKKNHDLFFSLISILGN